MIERNHSRTLRLLLIGMICLHASMAISRIAASLWVLNAGYGEWSVGLLLSLYSAGPMLLSWWAGGLSDRYGFHRPMRIAVGLAVFGGLAPAIHPSLASIGLGSLLTGTASSIGAIAVQRAAGRLSEQGANLKRVFSWIAIAPAVSNAIAPAISGALLDYSGFVTTLLVAAVIPACALYVCVKVPVENLGLRGTQASLREAIDLLSIKAYRRMLLLNLVTISSWDAHLFVVPVLGHAQQLSATQIGIVLGVFSAASILIRMAIVRWAEAFKEKTAMRVAVVIAMLGFLAYPWLEGFRLMLVGSACLGMSLGSVQPMLLSSIHQVTPDGRQGQALGLRSMALNGINLVMPSSFGLIANLSSSALPMSIMGILLGLSLCLLR